MATSFNLSARAALVMALFGFAVGNTQAQDPQTGLGRVYVRPMDNQLDVFLVDRMVKTHLPIVVSPTESRADCVMLLAPAEAAAPAKKSDRKLVLIDLQGRRIVWEVSVKTKDLSTLGTSAEKHLAAAIVGGMRHAGAYCGGSAFSAPTQNMEDRIKAFKPPTFNWDF